MVSNTNKVKIQDFCQYLNWDSEFFGLNIAKISKNTLNHNELIDISNWCKKNKIECLYFLVDPSCQRTNYLAMDNQFDFVDIRVTLTINLDKNKLFVQDPNSCVFRSSEKSDIPILREIASLSQKHSRFNFDPNFPNELCDKFYEKWIERSCGDFADVVLVAILGEKIVGYISCHLDDLCMGRIGLIAVKSNMRSLGVGTGLVNSALNWFSKNGVKIVSVVTQGRNIAPQKLYQKCGFISYSTMIWYHRWFKYISSERIKISDAKIT